MMETARLTSLPGRSRLIGGPRPRHLARPYLKRGPAGGAAPAQTSMATQAEEPN